MSVITDGISIDTDLSDSLIGNEVIPRLKHFEPFWPVIDGEVHNWGDIEKIIHHTLFSVLFVVPEDHPVLILETRQLNSESREKMMELMIESFNAPKY